MAQPPGNVTRSYSPSNLATSPHDILTPSSGPLNNSETYALATVGPIIASGNGQPHRREGQAYWDDTAPIITIPAFSSPAAGRSPLDSKMNSPESEEPTHPAPPTTQVGPATMQALDTALDDAMRTEDDSQTLWNNVPTLPADLPPQPEVIEVRGRSPGPTRTPRARSRAPSNASVWSNMTVESNVTDDEAQLMPPMRSLSKERVAWRSLAAAIRAGLLPDPYDPNLLDMTPVHNAVNDNIDTDVHELQATLTAEMAQSVTQLIQAWSTYRLTAPLCYVPSGRINPTWIWDRFAE
ncbi:hypothetical protein EDB83DRAFT_2520508 [Lactarius deliciosus]|nr:hypothetical protein EDB83DRAFT_2520508 [Lactarius deliciosus]